MHRLEQIVEASYWRCFPEKDLILVAVSGGVDSIVLLHILKSLKIPVHVLHCNFQLRGEASDADQRFVEEYCHANGIAMQARRFETTRLQNKGESVQMVARRLRYDWFFEELTIQNAKGIALAHHQDDQLETFLFNWSRAAGVDGLAGMREWKDKKWRPLLKEPREAILDYAKEHALDWREDLSNNDTKYSRNKIRKEWVPHVRQWIDKDQFNQTVSHLQDASQALWYFEQQAFSSLINERGEVLKSELSSLPKLSQFRFLKQFGFTSDQINNISTSAVGAQFISGDHVIEVRADRFILRPKITTDSIDLSINKGEEMLEGSSFVLKFSESDSWEKGTLANCIYFDGGRIKYPLRLRNWKQGDRFVPLGMKSGSQLVSDYMIDRKFTAAQKAAQLILEDASGQIIWLVGQRLDDRSKVSDLTSLIIYAQFFET